MSSGKISATIPGREVRFVDNDRQEYRLSCLHCGAKVTADRGRAGSSVPCPECGGLVGVPPDDGIIEPVKEEEAPPPPKLKGWPRQLQGLKYAAAETAIHALFIWLFVVTALSPRSCLGSPWGMVLVGLYPGHVFLMGIPAAIWGATRTGLFAALVLPLPLSMLYVRIMAKMVREMRQKGCLWSLAAAFILAIIVVTLSCIMVPVLH